MNDMAEQSPMVPDLKQSIKDLCEGGCDEMEHPDGITPPEVMEKIAAYINNMKDVTARLDHGAKRVYIHADGEFGPTSWVRDTGSGYVMEEAPTYAEPVNPHPVLALGLD